MKSVLLWGLGALNLLLAVVVVNRFMPEQKAMAQVGRPSDYMMVPGELNGVATGVVFILDTSKGELSAMSYDENTNKINPMPKIDLANVFNAGAGVGDAGRPIRPR